MVDYNKLFDVLYSDTIPFSVKESILESVKDQVSEEISEAEESPCINILNILAYSDMSEDTTNEIIDRVFGELDEAEVEVITNKFIKESCLNVIASGEIPVMEGSTDYIGLARMRRDERASHIHNDTPKPTVMDKLKGAVNKVKTAAKNSLPGYILQDRPVGLSHIKGLDKIKPEAKKAEAKHEAPKAAATEAPKAEEKKARTSLVPVKSGVPAATKTATEAPKAETKTPQAQITASKVYSLPDLQKGKKAGRKEKVEQLKLNVGQKDVKVRKITPKKKVKPTKEVKANIQDTNAKVEEKRKKEGTFGTDKDSIKKDIAQVKAEKQKAEGKKSENKEAEAPKETTARSDGKFKERVDALRKKMGVDDTKLNPDLVNKLGDKKNKPAKEKVEDVKSAEATKTEAKVETTPAKTAKVQTPKAGGNKEEKIQSPLKNLHNKIQAAADKKQGKATEEKKETVASEAPKVEAKTTEAPKTVKSAEAPRAEENKNKNIGKVDKKVQANASSSMTDEEKEAKREKLRYKRQAKDEINGISKSLEDLRSQLNSLKSRPGSSATDIQSLEQRIKDAEKKKADKEKDYAAAYESLTNPILNSLLTSAISESSMEEILEMVCSKALAQKAAERERKQADDSMNNLNKVIEVEAQTGKSPVTPEEKQELVDKANKDAEKYESVKASVERKYGK